MLLIRGLLLIQVVAALVYLAQFSDDVFRINALNISWEVHEFIEVGTVLSLIIGSTCSLYVLISVRRRNEVVESQLKVAAGQFEAVLQSKFQEWGLSEKEKEVALLSLKGFSVAEVADMRAKSLGTIKSQNASVYRKAGVSGRAQLMASLMEDLLDHAVAQHARKTEEDNDDPDPTVYTGSDDPVAVRL
ncbi:MAG: helix-turn-helix transcriptional regulator [Pseudomonadota bacterium]